MVGCAPQTVSEQYSSLAQRQEPSNIVGGVPVQLLIGYIGRIAWHHGRVRID